MGRLSDGLKNVLNIGKHLRDLFKEKQNTEEYDDTPVVAMSNNITVKAAKEYDQGSFGKYSSQHEQPTVTSPSRNNGKWRKNDERGPVEPVVERD